MRWLNFSLYFALPRMLAWPRLHWVEFPRDHRGPHAKGKCTYVLFLRQRAKSAPTAIFYFVLYFRRSASRNALSIYFTHDLFLPAYFKKRSDIWPIKTAGPRQAATGGRCAILLRRSKLFSSHNWIIYKSTSATTGEPSSTVRNRLLAQSFKMSPYQSNRRMEKGRPMYDDDNEDNASPETLDNNDNESGKIQKDASRDKDYINVPSRPCLVKILSKQGKFSSKTNDLWKLILGTVTVKLCI